jgi:hypothetical protein
MLGASHDTRAHTDIALEAYGRALEPKRLELMEGGHFCAYEADFDRSSDAARTFFASHL